MLEPKALSCLRSHTSRAPWREHLFWLFLLPAFPALGSAGPWSRTVGLVETCGFLAVAVSSLGQLRYFGLEFIAWNSIGWKAVVVCGTHGLLAGTAIIVVARQSGQPLGVGHTWNIAILAVVLGPVLEEVLFRGYAMALLLHLATILRCRSSSAVSVCCAAILFSAAHLGHTDITALQLACITITGWIYGSLRLRFNSTAAAALAHATYHLTLYLSYWLSA